MGTLTQFELDESIVFDIRLGVYSVSALELSGSFSGKFDPGLVMKGEILFPNGDIYRIIISPAHINLHDRRRRVGVDLESMERVGNILNWHQDPSTLRTAHPARAHRVR